MLIALLTVVLNVVNTSGEYLFGRYVVDTANTMFGTDAPTPRRASGSSARPTAALQLREPDRGSAAALRGLARLRVPRRRPGAFHPPDRRALRLPADAPGPVVRAMRCCRSPTQHRYSLGNTTKQALWLPTSRQAKVQCEAGRDSFCVRPATSSGRRRLPGERAALAVPGFAAVNVVLAAAARVAAGLNARLRAQERKAEGAAKL